MFACATTRVITPPATPVFLGGYEPDRRAFRVETDLEVNCLRVVVGDNTLIVLTFDLLYVTAGLRNQIMEELLKLGLKDEQVFMAASHTHFAPAIDVTKPLLGCPEISYLNHVAELTVEAVRQLLDSPTEPVTISLKTWQQALGVNRRRMRRVRLARRYRSSVLPFGLEFNQAGMGPNVEGPIDPIITAISFMCESQIIAVLWSGSCHPTGQCDKHCVDSDFPGVVRGRLREAISLAAWGSATPLPVLFLQGFSGDVRPPSGRKNLRSPQQLVRALLLGSQFEPLSTEEYRLWTSSIAESVREFVMSKSNIQTATYVQYRRLNYSAGEFADGADALPPVSFHSLQIGSLIIVGASAEVVSEYAIMVRRMRPECVVIPVGCIDHVIGYWPTSRMIPEGGYEVRHHCHSFGIRCCVAGIEQRVLDGFAAVLVF